MGTKINFTVVNGKLTKFEGKKPTCKRTGYTKQTKCKNCGKILSFSKPLLLNDHDFDENGICKICKYNKNIIVSRCNSGSRKLVEYEFNCSTGVLKINGAGDIRANAFGTGTTTKMGQTLQALHSMKDYVTEIKTVIINEGVTDINKNAFRGCINLESVTIPHSIESIDESAFAGCINLTNIKIPDSAMKVCYNAFKEYLGFESSIDLHKEIVHSCEMTREEFFAKESGKTCDVPVSINERLDLIEVGLNCLMDEIKSIRKIINKKGES